MTNKDGGPAFPNQELNPQQATESIGRGMSLRDYFAPWPGPDEESWITLETKEE